MRVLPQDRERVDRSAGVLLVPESKERPDPGDSASAGAVRECLYGHEHGALLDHAVVVTSRIAGWVRADVPWPAPPVICCSHGPSRKGTTWRNPEG